MGSERWRNICETGIYSETTLAGKTAIDFQEQVSPELLKIEKAAFGIRTLRGLTIAEASPWDAGLETLREEGLVKVEDGRWLLTRRGRLMADTVGEIFV